MPVYEFECSDCQEVFEKLCRLESKGSENFCPRCGNSNLKKLVSSFRTSVKGNAGGSMPLPSSGGCGPCSSSCGSCG